MRNAMRLGVLIAFEVAAVVALQALGELPWLQVPRTDVAHWATVTPPEDVFAAVARLAALGCAYWLLISTLCYTAAAVARAPRLVRVAGWATLPAVRRVTDRAVAVALVTSAVVAASPVGGASAAAGASSTTGVAPVVGAPAPVAAAPAPPIPPLPPPVARGPSSSDAAAAPPGAPAPPFPASPPADPSPASPSPDLPDVPPPDRGGPGERPPSAPATHVVQPGDNLWAITVTHLEARGVDASVHAVWTEVVAANRDRLRSGDPDVIHPGETITLSPLPEQGSASSS